MHDRIPARIPFHGISQRCQEHCRNFCKMGHALTICQLDFAHAYDLVRQEAVWNAMYKRGVPILQPLTTHLWMVGLATDARELWQTACQGLELEAIILQVRAWADDLYLFATDDQMETMIKTLGELAQCTEGLSLRPEMCKWAKVRRDKASEPVAQHPTCGWTVRDSCSKASECSEHKSKSAASMEKSSVCSCTEPWQATTQRDHSG